MKLGLVERVHHRECSLLCDGSETAQQVPSYHSSLVPHRPSFLSIAGTTEESYLLASFLWFAQLFLLYVAQARLPRDSTALMGWALSY